VIDRSFRPLACGLGLSLSFSPLGCFSSERDGSGAGPGSAGSASSPGGATGNGGAGSTPSCPFEGTYEPLQTQIVEGSCDIPLEATSLGIRELPGGSLGVVFDDTDWDSISVSADACSFTASTADVWLYNDTLRRRVLTVSIEGDELRGEMTDWMEGQDSQGRSCDVRYRLSAARSDKPPPMGAPLGSESCGGLGCSGGRCAFGNMPACDSGVCLFDTTIDPWDVICTQPCSDDAPCPEGYSCLEVVEAFDTAEGSYCGTWRAICGNGQQEEGEGCDDGNKDGGDGCSTLCAVEGCGNQLIDVNEDCDPSVSDSALPCTETCTYDLPAGAQGVVPGTDAFLWGTEVAALSDGNLVVAWLAEVGPSQYELWLRRLSNHGAGKDVPVLLATGALRSDTFSLAGSSAGAVLLAQDDVGQRVFITAADGSNVREITPFPYAPGFLLNPGGMVAAGAARDAIFAEGWYQNEGSLPLVLRNARASSPEIVPLTEPGGCPSTPAALAFAQSGDLVALFSGLCQPGADHLSVLGSSASSFTAPVSLPVGDDGSTLWPQHLVGGASAPTLVAQRALDDQGLAITMGHFASGSWTFDDAAALDTDRIEQLVDVAALPDGSVAVVTTRATEDGLGVETRYGRESSPGVLTLETVATGQAYLFGVDGAGTAHLLVAVGSDLMHQRISSSGDVGELEPLWEASYVWQKTTSEDGDFFVLDETTGVLFHLQ
jgi:cysteine-rich repeat protein